MTQQEIYRCWLRIISFPKEKEYRVHRIYNAENTENINYNTVYRIIKYRKNKIMKYTIQNTEI